MIKLTVDGFDIEIQNDGENISVKVLDASGKELSNNSYSQTMEGNTDETEELVSTEIEDETQTDEEVEDDTTDTSDDLELDETDDLDELTEIEESFDDFFKKLKEK